MKTAVKIIKVLLENNKAMTIREISKKIKADYKITHTAAHFLIKKKVLTAETVGGSTLCKLNKANFTLEIYQAENERKENLLKNKNILQLYKEIIEKIKTSSYLLLVFGSYAQNKQTKSSDIDLMFISNEKNIERDIDNILSLLPLKTHALVFTEEEFKKMYHSRKSNVVQEAVKSYIILFGTENFYHLINKNE